MNNVYSGSAVLFICALAFFFSFRTHQESRSGAAIFLLMAAGFILRLYSASDPFLHGWDERYHALVAKHLLSHFFKPTLYDNPVLPYDYTNWTANYVWVHKQPLPLWLIAVSLKFFGLHPWAVRMPSVILSTTGIKLTYDIARYLYGRNVAFIASFLFAIQGLIIELTAGRQPTDHIDTAFLFFILLAAWCGVKSVQNRGNIWIMLTGAAMGCAILCKWLPALIVIPVWLVIFHRKENGITRSVFALLLILLSAAIVALPWQLYIINHFPKEAAWEYAFNIKHFYEVLSGQGGSFFFYFDELRMSFGELIYLPVIWFSYTALRQHHRSDLAILLWFWAPYLFFSLCATKMAAYTIISAPAVFIITALAFVKWQEASPRARWQKIILSLIAWCLLLLPVRFTIDRLKPFSREDNSKWMAKISEFKNSSLNNSKTVIFNFDHPIEMMFATNCTCYEGVPDSLKLARLREKGYTTVVLNK